MTILPVVYFIPHSNTADKAMVHLLHRLLDLLQPIDLGDSRLCSGCCAA